MLCSDHGDPTVTIAIQGTAFALVVAVVTFIMLKYEPSLPPEHTAL
jgi:hypothetical protein